MKHIREILPVVQEEIEHRSRNQQNEQHQDTEEAQKIRELRGYTYRRPVDDLPNDAGWMR